MATKPTTQQDPLVGQNAFYASLPMADSPRGGADNPFRGVTEGDPTQQGAQQSPQQQPPQPTDPFANAGPLLEANPKDLFSLLNGLVLRQELIALNHLAQDVHYTYVKLGYPWSTLYKEPNKDRYRQELPYGSGRISVQAVPNKAWDMVNKTTEALLADFAQLECEPDDDSERAQATCDLADRFLAQDGSEHGTNDNALFRDRVEKALVCASSYLECWTDPTGGGYVPLQIKAHPLAEDANNPLVGPDGTPTSDYVLRYVTPERQFTDDPAQAAPQWLPKLRASKWNREHIRCYPETSTVENAEKVIVLGYCTLGEARRRWKLVGQMQPTDLTALTDWTPPRYQVLLPPFQRARWKLSDGMEKNKSGSADERIMFYYHVFVRPSPDHPKGADLVVNGINGGVILDKRLLAAPVSVQKGQGTATELRCMEIPIVQVTPRQDPDETDPTGRAYIELGAGAVENNAFLAMTFAEGVSNTLSTPFVVPSTSPIEGYQIREARASGDMLIINRPEDKPTQLNPPVLPPSFFQMYELADNQLNSIYSQNRPAQGSDNQQEVSGKARQIAVSQNNVSLSGMNAGVNNAIARWGRIKIERAMADFSTAQQLSYIGEDGAYKQDEWTGVDFAVIGKVSVKAGTGTLLPDDQKVNYLANLSQGPTPMLTPQEAADAARPAFSRRLGLPPNPHQQYVERCIDAWLKGPPPGDPNVPGSDWLSQFNAFQQYQQTAQQAMLQYQQVQQQAQLQGILPPPPPALPPAPPAPWNPFAPRPNDNELQVANLWASRISNVMSSVKYDAMPPEWRSLLDQKYSQAVQALQPPPQMPRGVSIVAKGDQTNIAAEEQAAMQGVAPPSTPPAQPPMQPPMQPPLNIHQIPQHPRAA